VVQFALDLCNSLLRLRKSGLIFYSNREQNMTPIQIAFAIGASILLIKLVASLFGYGNNPILTYSVTAVLATFVAFEIIKLAQFFLGKTA
jgi:hypothetical protein